MRTTSADVIRPTHCHLAGPAAVEDYHGLRGRVANSWLMRPLSRTTTVSVDGSRTVGWSGRCRGLPRSPWTGREQLAGPAAVEDYHGLRGRVANSGFSDGLLCVTVPMC